jgi:hypothetical protein
MSAVGARRSFVTRRASAPKSGRSDRLCEGELRKLGRAGGLGSGRNLMSIYFAYEIYSLHAKYVG